ncbi:MAG: LPS-assembly protein LptD [Opitutales bacterium]
MATILIQTISRALATSLFLCGLLPSAYAQQNAIGASLSTPFSYDTETGELIATVNAQLTYGDWLLTANEIRFNQKAGRALASGNVVFTRGDIRLVADSLDYYLKDNNALIENFRVGNGKYYVSGRSLQGNPDDFRFQDINFHPGEPGTYLFKARADEIAIVNQNEIQGKRLSFKLGLIPFFIIPNVSQPIDGERNLFKVDLDYSGHIGGSISNEIRIPISSHLRAGANITLTTKRGILAGPAFEYDFGEGENTSSGGVTSGFINDDTSLIQPDLITGNPIDDERFFAEWQHQQHWGDHGAINAYGRWWSDINVTREFHEDSFDTMQDPDTFIEANYSGENWQATFFSRVSPNNFQTFTERLPEIRFDLFPSQVAPGLIHQGSLSFAKLRKRFFDPITADNETNRADAYYGIRYSKPLNTGITLTSKAGVKAVHYFDNIIETDAGNQPWIDSSPLAPLSIIDDFYHIRPRPSIKAGTRAYGDLGFDLKFTAFRQSGYKNETWNIDGLRHIFEPTLSYRYTPDLDSNSTHALHDIPGLSNYLTPIDIEDRRDIDTIGEHHITRIALRNRIQTKDEDYGSRDIIRFDFSMDYLIDDYDQGTDFSDLYSDIEIKPANWLEIDVFSRYNVEDSVTKELNTRLAITDPGYWKIGIGNHFLKQHLQQYFLFGEYHLNENFKVYAVAKFDEISDTFYEQRIGLMQRALEKYGVKYELRIFEGNRLESDYGIRIGVDLFDE